MHDRRKTDSERRSLFYEAAPLCRSERANRQMCCGERRDVIDPVNRKALELTGAFLPVHVLHETRDFNARNFGSDIGDLRGERASSKDEKLHVLTSPRRWCS
jgi:hypothetical protein